MEKGGHSFLVYRAMSEDLLFTVIFVCRLSLYQSGWIFVCRLSLYQSGWLEGAYVGEGMGRGEVGGVSKIQYLRCFKRKIVLLLSILPSIYFIIGASVTSRQQNIGIAFVVRVSGFTLLTIMGPF